MRAQRDGDRRLRSVPGPGDGRRSRPGRCAAKRRSHRRPPRRPGGPCSPSARGCPGSPAIPAAEPVRPIRRPHSDGHEGRREKGECARDQQPRGVASPASGDLIQRLTAGATHDRPHDLRFAVMALSADQRAMLELLLGRGQSYEDLSVAPRHARGRGSLQGALGARRARRRGSGPQRGAHRLPAGPGRPDRPRRRRPPPPRRPGRPGRWPSDCAAELAGIAPDAELPASPPKGGPPRTSVSPAPGPSRGRARRRRDIVPARGSRRTRLLMALGSGGPRPRDRRPRDRRRVQAAAPPRRRRAPTPTSSSTTDRWLSRASQGHERRPDQAEGRSAAARVRASRPSAWRPATSLSSTFGSATCRRRGNGKRLRGLAASSTPASATATRSRRWSRTRHSGPYHDSFDIRSRSDGRS